MEKVDTSRVDSWMKSGRTITTMKAEVIDRDLSANGDTTIYLVSATKESRHGEWYTEEEFTPEALVLVQAMLAK